MRCRHHFSEHLPLHPREVPVGEKEVPAGNEGQAHGARQADRSQGRYQLGAAGPAMRLAEARAILRAGRDLARLRRRAGDERYAAVVQARASYHSGGRHTLRRDVRLVARCRRGDRLRRVPRQARERLVRRDLRPRPVGAANGEHHRSDAVPLHVVPPRGRHSVAREIPGRPDEVIGARAAPPRGLERGHRFRGRPGAVEGDPDPGHAAGLDGLGGGAR
mmetsp:Transcript_60902/g.176118  ORF Transcript_60902/g.176118 Transcript_60902/m.176118 type:complete len:219 (-) Transcript_60902:901-1557(-)